MASKKNKTTLVARVGQPLFRIADAGRLDWIVLLDDGAVAAASASRVVIFEKDGTTRLEIDSSNELYEKHAMLNPRVAISPDGRELAFLDGNKLVIQSIGDTQLRVLDVKAKSWKYPGFGHELHWSKSGTIALCSSNSPRQTTGWSNRTLFHWNASFEMTEIPIQTEKDEVGFAISPSGTHVMVGNQVIAIPSGKHVRAIETPSYNFGVSDGGEVVYTFSEERNGAWVSGIWDDERKAFNSATEDANAIRVSPDRTFAAVQGLKGLGVVDLVTHEERFFHALGDNIEALTLANGRVACGAGPRVVIYDVESGADLASFEGALGNATLSNGAMIVAKNDVLGVFDREGKELRTIDTGSVHHLVGANGVVAIAGERGVQVANVDDGSVCVIAKPFRNIDSLGISSDGERVIAGVELDDRSRLAIVWSAMDGKELARGKKHPALVDRVALGDDSFASASSESFAHGDTYGDDTTVHIHGADGALIEEKKIKGRLAGAMAFFKGTLLVTTEKSAWRIAAASSTHTVRVRDDGYELWAEKKSRALTIPGTPVALEGNLLLASHSDGTYGLYEI